MSKKWKVRSSKYLINKPWLKVRRDDIQIKDEILDYYIVEEKDGVVVVAITDDNKVVLLKQYKIGVGKELLVLPSGYIEDKHSDHKHAAELELSEEAGYKAGKVEKIGQFYRSPGRYTQKVHVFLASNLIKVERELEIDEEEIEVELIELKKVQKKIEKGEIEDMETIVSILLVRNKIDQ